MAENFVDKTIEAWKQFVIKKCEQPTKLHLTKADEIDLIAVFTKNSGGLSQTINQKGIRIAIPKILGCDVIYDDDRFGFE
jgi:hypothetical protein